MSPLRAIVLVLPDPPGGPMVSRLPTCLHPVAGRPLIWHTVNGLLAGGATEGELLVLTPADFPAQVLEDLASSIRITILDPASEELRQVIAGYESPILAIHGCASIDPAALQELTASGAGSWIGGLGPEVPATVVDREQMFGILESANPLAVDNGVFDPAMGVQGPGGTFIVRNRHDLARLTGRVREQVVRSLMEGGVSFLLPESVHVDVDVRIGRDTVLYPGVVIEGQTTIGEETVIGPGCRIIDSWIGSGVELKGWNYVAHASVRNRAILEPYVRRGFD